MAEQFNFQTLIEAVGTQASNYETELVNLQTEAGKDGSLDISKATVATTKIQVAQALTEMATGIAKNAATHTQKIGKSVGG